MTSGRLDCQRACSKNLEHLTLDERREMQRHSEIGERILGNVDTYSEIAAIVRHHHERVDGQGYPDGLAKPKFRFCRGSSLSLMRTTR